MAMGMHYTCRQYVHQCRNDNAMLILFINYYIIDYLILLLIAQSFREGCKEQPKQCEHRICHSTLSVRNLTR